MRNVFFVIAMLISTVAYGDEWVCQYANVRGTIGLSCTDGVRVAEIPTFGDHRDSPDEEAAWERVVMLVEIAVCGRSTYDSCDVTISNNRIAGTTYASLR